MKVVYFAWVRERVGGKEEQIDSSAKTIAALLDELEMLTPAHKLALSDREVLRFALDQTLVDEGAALGDAKELAIFPPMTGG
ncbi:MAG: molybdopterin converting factor subunit 1 [Pseudomonadota bacterium]